MANALLCACLWRTAMLQAILSVGGGLLYSTGSLVGVGDFAHLRKFSYCQNFESSTETFRTLLPQLRCGIGARVLCSLGCFHLIFHSLQNEDSNDNWRLKRDVRGDIGPTSAAVLWGGGVIGARTPRCGSDTWHGYRCRHMYRWTPVCLDIVTGIHVCIHV